MLPITSAQDQTIGSNFMKFSGVFKNVRIFDPNATGGGGTTTELIPIYRGVSGSQFVFSEGSPPGDATQVTIIGFK